MAHTFTSQNFQEEVLNSNIPVLIDFWAPWCGPCQMMTPIIQKLAQDYKDKVKIGKLNVDEAVNQPIVAQYGIQGIPAFKIFKNGQIITEFVGARSEADLKTEIEKVL